jgi:sugar lactone lactonase YvrE
LILRMLKDRSHKIDDLNHGASDLSVVLGIAVVLFCILCPVSAFSGDVSPSILLKTGDHAGMNPENARGTSARNIVESGMVPYVFVTSWGSGGSGDGNFYAPCGIARDASGNIFVADTGNYRIQKFTANGVFLLKWGGYGSSADGRFYHPRAVAVDSSGNVYVGDETSRIQKFNASGGFLKKWGSAGSGNGQFDGTDTIAIGPTGNVYIGDALNYRIQKFTSNGTYLSKWGTSGTGNSQFMGIRSIAIDSSGNVYVSDYANNRIQKFTADGVFLLKWGSMGSGDGQLNSPAGIAVDSDKNVYVSDFSNDRIQKFNANGVYLTQWGSHGTGNGTFRSPVGVAVDPARNVYVAEFENNRVQKFAPTQTITGITPASGIRGNTVMITNISGTNFAAGAKISLNKTGYPLITATNVMVVNTKMITCNFTIPASAPLGLRNLDVKNTNGNIETKANAFMVRAPVAPAVLSLQPKTGNRGAIVTITNLSGSGFVATPKPKVQLLKDTAVITATNVTVVSANRITCRFTIPAGASTGAWNASVTNGDNQKGMKPSAFTVNS